jgi:hypothetical protein
MPLRREGMNTKMLVAMHRIVSESLKNGDDLREFQRKLSALLDAKAEGPHVKQRGRSCFSDLSTYPSSFAGLVGFPVITHYPWLFSPSPKAI